MAISSKTENLRALSCSGSVVENKKSLNETLFTGSIGRWKVLPLVAISRMSVNLERRYHPPRPLFIRSWLWIRDKEKKKKKYYAEEMMRNKRRTGSFFFYAIIYLDVLRDDTRVWHLRVHKRERDVSLLWKGTRFFVRHLAEWKIYIEERDARCFNVFEKY